MAIGYHKLNSSAARRRKASGRAEKGVNTGGGEMPEWMTKNAIFRPGDVVVSEAFGRGTVQEFALTEVYPPRVLFDDYGEKRVTIKSIKRV